MVKATVDLATLSEPQIELALAHYGRRLAPPTGVEAAAVKLHNGYSGCNYRVLALPLLAQAQTEVATPAPAPEPEPLLLKGSADKPVAELCVQVELLRHLEAAGFPTAPAVPPAGSEQPWVIEAAPSSADAEEGDAVDGGGGAGSLAVFLLRFVDGLPANVLLGDSLVPVADILATAGTTLARLHLQPAPPGFRKYRDGVGTKDGLFDPATTAEIRATHPDPRVSSHAFLDFFERRIPALRSLVAYLLFAHLMATCFHDFSIENAEIMENFPCV